MPTPEQLPAMSRSALQDQHVNGQDLDMPDIDTNEPLPDIRHDLMPGLIGMEPECEFCERIRTEFKERGEWCVV